MLEQEHSKRYFCSRMPLSMSSLQFLAIFMIVTFSSLEAQVVRLDYVCPYECECATIPPEHNNVQAVCAKAAGFDNTTDFINMLQKNYTKHLTILCTQQVLKSQIVNHMFSRLTELEEITISGCILDEIPPNAFAGLPLLKKLSILYSGGKGTKFPKEILYPIPNLSELAMEGVGLMDFEEDFFCSQKNLKALNLTMNFFHSLEGIGVHCTRNICSSCLSQLEVLDLSYSFMTQLPSNFHTAFPKLKYLNLKANQISVLPDTGFQGFASLEILNLANNNLSRLYNKDLKGISTLKTLHLEFNEISQIDPHAFQNMSSLKYLDIQGNDIKYLPDMMLLDLSQLVYLNLSFNQLQHIPVNLLSGKQNLKEVNLAGNQITSLNNGTFQGLNNLTALDLSSNEMETVNIGFFNDLDKLIALNLGNNQIGHISDTVLQDSNIKSLNLSYNKLTQIPKTLRHLHYLEILTLEGNLICNISENDLFGLPKLKGLSLKNNNLTAINYKAFSHTPVLWVLNLSRNKLSYISPGTFDWLGNLGYINLEHNRLQNIEYLCDRLLNLRNMYFAHNEITWISSRAFPINIFMIDVSYNNISYIELETFSKLRYLFNVDLRYNRLRTFTDVSLRVSSYTRKIPGFEHVPNFYLQGNFLDCACNMTWFLLKYGGKESDNLPDSPRIADIDNLSYCWDYSTKPKTLRRFTKELMKSLICEFKGHLYYDVCQCWRTCPQNCTCKRSYDWTKIDVSCSNLGLTQLPRVVETKTNRLELKNNNLTTLTSGMFSNFGYLLDLDLQNSNVANIQNGTFLGLGSLNILRLNDNKLTKILDYTFDWLVHITELYLDHNYIQYISHNAFEDLDSLETLTLDHNQISQSLDGIFGNLNRLSSLTLSVNAFSCDCNFSLQFKHWLTENAMIIPDLPKITCHLGKLNNTEINGNIKVITNSTLITEVQLRQARKNITNTNSTDKFPQGGHDQSLSNNSTVPYTSYTPQYTSSGETTKLPIEETKILKLNLEELCFNVSTPSKPEYLLAESTGQMAALITVAAVFLLTIISTVIIYKYRNEIRVLIFMRYGIRLFTKPTNDDNKIFDAFISYSTKDERLIVHELAPKLEYGNPKYRLCLHYRDFPVGASIAETIIHAVDESKRTLMILSKNYLESEWCLYEFQTAHHQALKDKMNRLIVVLLDDIPLSEMDPEIRLYVKTKTYLKWDDPWFWEKLKYALPDVKEVSPDSETSVKIQNGLFVYNQS